MRVYTHPAGRSTLRRDCYSTVKNQKALGSEFVKIRIWPAHPFLASLAIVGGASIAVQLLLSHDAALEKSK